MLGMRASLALHQQNGVGSCSVAMLKVSCSSEFVSQVPSLRLTTSRWKEYLSPPTPTQSTVRRIDNGWPFLENISKPSPDVTSNSPAALRLQDIIPRFYKHMDNIGRGNCSGMFVQDQYDFDKRAVLKQLRKEMRQDRTYAGGTPLTEFEFDECIRYFESINEQWACVFFLGWFSRIVC
jgi:hypothetical protein